MIVIANNLRFHVRRIEAAFELGDPRPLNELAQRYRKAGADIIELSFPKHCTAELVKFAVSAVNVPGLRLCLDAQNPHLLEEAISVSPEPPLINYLSAEKASKECVLPLASRSGAEVVVYPVRKGVPADASQRIEIMNELVEEARLSGIPPERLYVDPVVVHLGGGLGQQQALAAQEVVRLLSQMEDLPVKTTCWASNIAAGSPPHLASPLTQVFLATLAALGLSSAFLNVLDPDLMRTVYLIKALRNEVVYSPSEVPSAVTD
jgi:cobalamin-dependent methionine synthase I